MTTTSSIRGVGHLAASGQGSDGPDDLIGLENETIRGGAGDDTLTGDFTTGIPDVPSDQDDYHDLVLDGGLYGDGGNDRLAISIPIINPDDRYRHKAIGEYTLDGGPGNDTIGVAYSSRSTAAIELSGGDGNDDLSADLGSFLFVTDVKFDGGTGNDTLSFSIEELYEGGYDDIVIDGGEGYDELRFLRNLTTYGDPITISGIEKLVVIEPRGLFSFGFFDQFEEIVNDAGADRFASFFVNESGTLDLRHLETSRLQINLDYDNAGPVTIYGSDAGSRLFADRSITDNTLIGGAGADTLRGGAGDDRLDGGAGIDTVSYAEVVTGVTVRLTTTGSQSPGADLGHHQLIRIENLEGSYGDDDLKGNSRTNQISGLEGDDLISGLAGDDTLSGGISGLDTIFGGDGDDIVMGESQEDMILGGAGDDSLFGGNQNDVLEGGEGDDRIDGGFQLQRASDTASYAGAGAGVTVRLTTTSVQDVGGGQGRDQLIRIDNLIGSAFGDSLKGSSRVNQVSGGDGADTLVGLDANDTLIGGAGGDTIDGGSDRDIVTGGGGIDFLTGGAGADRFVYAGSDFERDLNAGADRILDFGHADGDRIDLSAIDAATGGGNDRFVFIGNAAFSGTAGELRYDVLSSSLWVRADLDGDGRQDLKFQLVGAEPLVATDFIL